MNQEYLQGLHTHLGVTDDYNTWVSAVKDNDDYLQGLHGYLGIDDNYDTWKTTVFGEDKKEELVVQEEVETEEVKPYAFKTTAEEKEKPGDLLLTAEAKKEIEKVETKEKPTRSLDDDYLKLQKENKLKYDISNDKNGILDFLVSDKPEITQKKMTTFFDSTEEDAIRKMEAIFGKDENSPFEYEESNDFKNFNKVIIKHKASGKEVELDFGIGRLSAADATLQSMYKSSNNKLFNFVNETLGKEDILKTQKTQTQLAREIEILEQEGGPLHISTIEAGKINDKYLENENLFTPITKQVNISRDPKFPQMVNRTEEPHKEKLERSKQILINQGNENPTQQEIESLTRQTLYNEKYQELYDQKMSNYMNSDEVEETDLASKVKMGSEIKDSRDRKELLTYELNFNSKLNRIENLPQVKRVKDILSVLNDPNQNFEITEGEEVVTLEDGRKMPKSLYNQYQIDVSIVAAETDLLNEWYDENSDKMMELTGKVKANNYRNNLIQRNYNDWDKFFTTMGSGFMGIVNKAAYGASKLQSSLIGYDNKILDNEFLKMQDAQNAYHETFQKDVKFENAFNRKNFGRFVAQEFAQQAPIFATLAIPHVGIATLGLSSAGENWERMVRDDEFWGKETSQFKKFMTSVGYGTAEVVFDRWLTLPVMKRSWKSMYGIGENAMLSGLDGLKLHFKQNGKRALLYDPLLETSSEGLTTITQNIITGKPIGENLGHALFSGGMFGTMFGHVPFYKGVAMNYVSDYDSKKKYRDNLVTIADLETKLDGTKQYVSPSTAKILNEELNALKKENETILEDVDKKANSISKEWWEAYNDAVVTQEDIRIKVKDIMNDKSLTNKEKNRVINRLQDKFYKAQSVRDALRDEKTFGSKFSAFLNSDIKQDVDRRERILGQVTSQLIEDGNTNPSDNQINEAARIAYNIEEINKDFKNKRGRTKLGRSIENYQTVEEAIAAINKMDNISDKNKAAAIKNIEDGGHGANMPTTDGNFLAFQVVENMAKDDRLETRTHELGHTILSEAVSMKSEAFDGIAEQILNYVRLRNPNLHTLLKARAGGKSDEVITNFLELVAEGKMDLKSKNNKGLGALMGYLFSKGVQKATKSDVEFNFEGETDAIVFITQLAKKIKAGTLKMEDRKAVAKSKLFEPARRIGKILDALAPDDAGAVKMSEAKGSQTTVKEDLFKETNNALIEALEMYGMENPERLLSEDINVRKELAKEWEALGDSRFWIGTVIGEKWRRFVEVNYLQKRDKAANYNLYKDQILDVVTTGIEKGDNGIPFLVRSWKPAEEGGRTLTSHIFGEVGTRLMGTNGIIDRKFPQFDKFISTIDMSRDEGGIDVAGDLDIETVLETEKIKKKRKQTLEEDRYRKLIGIDDKFATEIKNVIKEVLLTGDLGLISDFAWTQRFSKAAQKKLFKIIKNEMKDYEAFLKKTRKPFLKHAHTSDLVQMEKNEKNKIFAKLKAVNASPNKIKIALLEGLIQPFEVKSMTQGPNIYEKVDTKEQEFIDFMKVRGRKDAFVKNNINIMAMDAVFDVLLNETIEVDGKQVRVLDEFIRQQREKGLPHVSNVLSIVKERINRDQDVKFSSTVRGFNPLELRVFYGKLDAFGEVLDATNVGDEAAVYQAVYSIWGDDYNQTKLKALSNDLFKLVKRYATIDKNHTNLKTQPEQKLNEYLYDNIKAAELELNLAEYLELKDENGKLMKFSELFDDTGRLNNQRSAIINFGKKLIENYGREKALMMMIHAGGMYSTSTQISRGNHLVNDSGKIYKITEDQITKLDKKGKRKTQFSSQRYQSFTGKKDWNINVMQVVFPELKLTKAKNLEKFQNLDGVVDEKGKLKKIDTSLLAESSEKGMEDRNFEAREAQAKLSEEFVRDIAQYYKDNKALDKIDFGMLMMSMSSNMQSPLKRAANLKYIYKDKKGKKYKGKFRYEHMIPTNFMVLKITDAYMNDKSDVDLDALFKEYTVAIIPVTMDNIMEEMNFINTMPIGFEAGQSSRVRYYNMSTFGHPDLYAIESLDPKDKGRIYGEGVVNIKFSESFKAANIFGKAVDNARTVSEPRGITVLDFDDTLATTESLVKFTRPDGTTGTLNAEEYASTYEDLLDKGYTFDFSDFNKVVKGKLAPLFKKAMKLQKKFGPKNMFVLTARPPAAQKPIFDFLKANGLNIPLENITGLGNSTSEAKALWIADKVADGYNDFYFADDALQNVQAVKNMLDQFDVKSKVQQAKVKFSKGASKEFNDILEQTKGLPSDYMISQAKARQRGKRKGLFQFFVPPSADDFAGLLQMFQGKGKQGMEHAAWFKKNLLDPFARGDRSLNGARQRTAEEFKALRKKFPKVSKKLRKVIPTGDYTFGDAIRVYLWDKNGIEVPGLTKTDQNNMLKLVKADPEIQAFADVLGVISRKEDGYIAPDEYWMTKDIVADITEDGIIGDGRKDHLAEWIENKDLIFTPENLNKIEFLYGSNFREALEDILYRMENGTSRQVGSNRIVNNFLNWMNGGISVVMNWNTRSAVLQTLSTVNFINWGDNNILAAGKAFANQKQYWKDFAFLFNSDMLKQRRAGLKTTIESRELMSEVEGAVNPVRAAIRYLLRIGFTPTKFADSFAIASGGATFYRNRINTYKKQGYNQTEAEAKAFIDFQETAEEGQQSSRPDRLSQQQTSVLGRLILAFQNTPMQYVRMSKKEILDLVNGRFTGFTGPNSFASKTGKIMYYTAVQNLIFYSMQTALFAAMFSDEEDDEEFFDKKTERIVDNLADSVLRGMGVGGAVISTLKNIILKYIANKDSKMYDESAILMEGLKLSPPLSIKARQLLSADKTMRYNRDVIKQMETFDIDNPMWNAAFNIVEMTTNAPLSRMESKYKNVRNALDNRYETWQRVAFMLGYNTWSLGVKNEEIEAIKKEIKAIKTYERKKKAQEEKQAKQAEKQALINKDVEKEKKLQEEGKLKDPKCRHVNTKGERCSVSVANAGDLCTIHEEVLQRTDGKKTRCKQVKADGKRCGMQTSNKSGYCYYHD